MTYEREREKKDFIAGNQVVFIIIRKSLIEFLARSTCINSGTNQLGSGSVCTLSFLKSCTCCTKANLGYPFFLKKMFVLVAQKLFKRQSQ